MPKAGGELAVLVKPTVQFAAAIQAGDGKIIVVIQGARVTSQARKHQLTVGLLHRIVTKVVPAEGHEHNAVPKGEVARAIGVVACDGEIALALELAGAAADDDLAVALHQHGGERIQAYIVIVEPAALTERRVQRPCWG